jgi:hypothetical protein
MPTALSISNATQNTVNTGTAVAIATSAVVFIAFITLLLLYWRKSTNYRQLLQDLEGKGIDVPRVGVKNIETTRPGRYKTVLTRTSPFAPLHSKTRDGWDQLESAESLGFNVMAEVPEILHQSETKSPTPPSRVSFVRRAFVRQSAIQAPPRHPIRTSQLSSLAKTQRMIDLNGLSSSPSPPPPRKSRSDGYAVQEIEVLPSMADRVEPFMSSPFTNTAVEIPEDDLKPKPLFSGGSGNVKTYLVQSAPQARVRKKRSETIHTSDRLSNGSPLSRPRIHARSFSLGDKNPGLAPKTPIPPVPQFTMSQSQAIARGSGPWGMINPRNMTENESRQSLSSFESVGSSFLATSPQPARSSSARIRFRGHRRDTSQADIIGPRHLRKAKSLHKQALSWSGHKYLDSPQAQSAAINFRHSLTSSTGIRGSITPRPHSIIEEPENGHTTPSIDHLQPSVNTLAPKRRSYLPATPKRSVGKDRDFTAEEPACVSPTQSQHSTGVSSMRSSNGNPFQWDYTLNIPKTSSPRASANRNRTQRRRATVRMSRPTSLRCGDSSPKNAVAMNDCNFGKQKLESSAASSVLNSRPLPRPPSSSTFEPELVISLCNPSMTSLRASLTSSSPCLSLLGFSNDLTTFGGSFELDASDSYQIAPKCQLSNVEFPSFPFPRSTGAATTFSFISSSNDADTIVADNSFANYLVDGDFVDLGDQRLRGQITSSSHSSKVDETESPMLQPGEIKLDFDSLAADQEPPKWRLEQRMESPPVSLKPKPTAMPDIDEVVEQLSKDDSPNEKDFERTVDSYPTKADQQDTGTLRRKRSSTIRQSISALRRMNSDAREDAPSGMKGPERYMNVGPLSTSPQREESWVSLMAEKILSKKRIRTSPQREPIEDFVLGLKRDDTISEPVWPSKNAQDSSVTVWEDRENFWKRLSARNTSVTLINNTTKALSTSPLRVNIQPPSNDATPRSFYDHEGFLIENSPNRELKRKII